MTPAEILNRAADLIEPEGAWTQFANARDASGNEISPWAPDAVCFCLYGAVRRLDGDSDGWYAEAQVAAVIGVQSAIDWNDADGRTQTEVVQALRDAAKASA